MSTESAPNTTLRGPRLLTARAAWIALVALTLTVFVALAPLNFRDIAADWQVTQSYPALARYVSQQSYAMYILTLRYIVALVFFVTAAVIFWRKSNDWLAMFASLTLTIAPLAFSLGGYTATWDIYPQPWRSLFRVTRDFLAVLGPFGFVTLFYLFPDGRFVPRWMRWAALGGLGTAFLLFPVFAAESIGGEGAWLVFSATLLASMIAATFGQIYRYRRVSTAVQRQQTKLVVFGLAAATLGFFIRLVLDFVAANPRYAALSALAMAHLSLFIPVLIPLSIAFSILRYRLWDIDLIINRALVYAALTAIVIGLYVLAVGAFGALFQVGGNLLLSILATGLIAILFQPLRQRLQRGVNRLMYGERDDPVTVLSRLGQRLESALAPDAVLATIVETVAQALKLPYAAIALKIDERPTTNDGRSPLADRDSSSVTRPSSDTFDIVATYGQPLDNPLMLPLIYQSETVGQLILAPRAPGEDFSPADRRLLESIARQAGAPAHAVRLTADLQHSRQRLVSAREEERRRLRRDLHDGLGPTLAGQALKLDATLDLLTGDPDTGAPPDPAAARALLAELKAQTQATVADIRRLVYELRPPALDELGLVSAIREHTMRYAGSAGGPHISIEAPAELPPLSAAIEVAAYRIALEAITNVVRHARACSCLVRFSLAEALQVEIIDDGVGLSRELRAGVGLASMRERAAELGGTCVIEPGLNGGTRVFARLPLMRDT